VTYSSHEPTNLQPHSLALSRGRGNRQIISG
jgi:hypothetical protein